MIGIQLNDDVFMQNAGNMQDKTDREDPTAVNHHRFLHTA
ncbi:hypothetical protein AF72_13030 [Xylella taiwanensis]|uniref:Uncharacterized protein n=1 Tax=Xylella taiwanensis TaxID=1444770 RepID=Z9JFU1_9GAMM|nr:hypothetical protein AF72_13030 [Xylella taiwanensis]